METDFVVKLIWRLSGVLIYHIFSTPKARDNRGAIGGWQRGDMIELSWRSVSVLHVLYVPFL